MLSYLFAFRLSLARTIGAPYRQFAAVVYPIFLTLCRDCMLRYSRVPPSQGMELYRALKRQNVPTRVLHYSDPHAIMKVRASCQTTLHQLQHLHLHLTRSSGRKQCRLLVEHRPLAPNVPGLIRCYMSEWVSE